MGLSGEVPDNGPDLVEQNFDYTKKGLIENGLNPV